VYFFFHLYNLNANFDVGSLLFGGPNKALFFEVREKHATSVLIDEVS
jgi:hypothetical protein